MGYVDQAFHRKGEINTMPPEQTGHSFAKLCFVVDGKEIELGNFFSDAQTTSDVDSDVNANIPDLTKPISGTIRIKKSPAQKKFRIRRCINSLFKQEFRGRFKSRYRRNRQIRQYLKLIGVDPNLFYELFLPRRLELDDIQVEE